MKVLVDAAAILGPMIHYKHPGFAANLRTQRMAGLAMIELAQAVQKALKAWKDGREVHAAV